MSNTGEPSHRPRPHRPRLWQRLLACVLMLTLQVSSFAQVAAPMIRGADGTVSSGYRAEGTLVLGSVVPGATTQVAGASVLAGTSGTVATVGSVVATGIGTTVASVAGAMVSTGIQTGSLDKAIKAGEGALKAGLVTTAVSALVPGLGITNGFLADSVNVVATAAGQTVGYGGDFGDNLFQTVINTGVEVVSQQAAGWIGQQTDWSPLGTELAHAGLGCAAGMVRSGSSGGCAPGATGAVVAHLGAQWLDPASGFTLSDKDVAFFTGLGGGVAAALVGSSDNIQSNFGIGQSTGQNAVEHNYLTTREINAALYQLEQCTQGCDVIRNSLLRNENQGGEQLNVGRIEDLCKANPQGCSGRVQEMASALEELQKPEVRAQLGERHTQALIQRQVDDLGKAVEALQWGVDRDPAARLIAQTALAVGATAVGGGVMLHVGRALIAACANGAGSPSCIAASTELAIGAMETAGGVPTVGMTVASTSAMATRLASAASNTSDMAQVVREVRLVQREAVVAREATQLASGQPLTRYMGVDIPSNLPAPAAGWIYAPDLVKGAKTDAAAFAHMTGFQGEVRVAADAVNRGESVVSWGGKIGTQGADVISVNPNTGEVTLYDAKTYSNATNVKPSPSFAPGSDALVNAREQAVRAIREADLPPALKQQALDNLDTGNFTTRTTNQGIGGSSPVAVKFCGSSICP